MAAKDLRLYVDYKSPYAYLAKDPVYDLEREFGVTFTWLPLNLHIPDFLGTVEGRNAHQWRRAGLGHGRQERALSRDELLSTTQLDSTANSRAVDQEPL